MYSNPYISENNLFSIFRHCIIVFLFLSTCAYGQDAKDGVSRLDSVPISMTISGGISLGVYEAGINWTLVELLRKQMRDSDASNAPFKLNTVTGTSAGAINALLSALRYCEVPGTRHLAPVRDDTEKDNVVSNRFFETWNVDIDELLPINPDEYNTFTIKSINVKNTDLRDSLFSRSAFQTVIDSIISDINTVTYRRSCSVNIGLLVTRVIPLEVDVELNGGSKSVNVQRFVVPLRLQIDKNGKAKFENNYEYSEYVKDKDNYIFLRENKNRQLHPEDVLYAVLASSAFPVAFGRVELSYCLPKHLSSKTAGSSSDECGLDTEFRSDSAVFFDGGVFDNIPLGAAVDLVESDACERQGFVVICENGQHGKGYFVYISPAGKTAKNTDVESSLSNASSLKLTDQISYLMPSLSTLRGQELTKSLIEDFRTTHDDSTPHDRQLLITKRSIPITGSYHGAFGAFHDREFRKYDFLVGVYYGLLNVSSFICNSQQIADVYCGTNIHDTFQLLKNVVLKPDSLECDRYCKFIDALYRWDHGEKIEIDLYNFNDSIKPIWILLQAFYNEPDITFDDLVTSIPASHRAFFGKRLQEILKSSNGEWALDYVDQIIRRLIDLEIDEKGKYVGALTTAWRVLPKYENGTPNKFGGAYSEKPNWFTRYLIPDSLGIDGWQSGLFANWTKPGILGVRKCNRFCKSRQTDLSFGYLVRMAENLDTGGFSNEKAYIQLGGEYKWNLKGFGISSVGVGIELNANDNGLLNPDIDNTLIGGRISFGLLSDNVHISVGTRDMERNLPGVREWSVRLGINFIPTWVYANERW